VLASRLGLIPLKANKDGLKWMRWKAEESSFTDYNTVVLHLDVECTWKEDGKKLFLEGVVDSEKLYNNSNG
jgi:DNA-directed RNA polymerase I and III subunit RPAC1